MTQVTEKNAKPNPPSPINMVLDFVPMVIYLLAYRYYKNNILELFGESYEGIVAATLISIPLMLLSMLAGYLITKSITPMQIFTLIMVGFFGGLTVLFNDESFTKMRPSLVYGAMGLALAFGVYIRGKSYFAVLVGRYLQLEAADWMKFTKAYILFMIVMVMINELVRRFMSDGAWVFLDTFGQAGLGLLFMLTQMRLIMRNLEE